jgi:protein-L-isoaspartate(D-aspartate) O-methyltransferase
VEAAQALNRMHEGFANQRIAMVELQLRSRGIKGERVLDAMLSVPRHEFVPSSLVADAYADMPLPIGSGQTISQPYIVAAMLEALRVREQDRVLEIGTGSGYMTALLAELAAEVVSMERHADLAERAREALAKLEYKNVQIVVGDGSQGYSPAAPYDGIIASAAAPTVPPALMEQLNEGGRMVIPVGPPHTQQLQQVRKISGQVVITPLDPCRFVPMIGESAYRAQED